MGGHGAFVPLRYASDSGAARICQRVGVKARERSDQAEVGCARGFPTVGKFFFYKTAFSCSLYAIIGGVGYVKSPLLNFVLLQSSGWGGWGLGFCSPKICH